MPSSCSDMLATSSEPVGEVSRLLTGSGGASWLFLFCCVELGPHLDFHPGNGRGSACIQSGFSRRAFRFLHRPVGYSLVLHWLLNVLLLIRGCRGFFLGRHFPLLSCVRAMFHMGGTGRHSESADILLLQRVWVRHFLRRIFCFYRGCLWAAFSGPVASFSSVRLLFFSSPGVSSRQ